MLTVIPPGLPVANMIRCGVIINLQPNQEFFVYGIKVRKGETMTNQPNQLRRSRRNRIIAGVCGGLGAFFGINAFWFRLLFFLLLLPGGLPGLIPYTILWIVIPKERRN